MCGKANPKLSTPHGGIIKFSFGDFSQGSRLKFNEPEPFAFVDKNFSGFSVFSKQSFEFILCDISR